jgi:hypothetical protein
MINGAHVIIYSKDAEADRAFFKDVLAFPQPTPVTDGENRVARRGLRNRGSERDKDSSGR